MSATNPVVHVNQIVLSPMQVIANGVDLGGTEGGVTLSIKTEWADVMVDQYGKTPLDKRVLAHIHGMKFILAEIGDMSKWKVAFPSAKLVGAGPNSFYFDMQIGDSLIAHATPWTFHPISNAPSDKSEDINLFLAAATGVSEVKYGPEKQSGLSVELTIFPDTAVVPPRLMLYGDPSIGAVNASAAAAVAGGGNVGNGTVTAIGVLNGVTKTETITISCVGTGSAGHHVFTVSGSVSGILGEFALADAPSSAENFSPASPTPDVIGFTLTQGSTAFALGDTFTIATTAANYV